MSAEMIKWLNENTLIGYSEELGSAWHKTANANNHYDDIVPIDAVERLFKWEAQLTPVYMQGDVEEGITKIEGRKALVHSDSRHVFNIVSDRYGVHQYSEWLLENISALLDESAGELGIGSAGLLRGGGQAWVQVRPSEYTTIGGENGESQLPWLLATTSHDGTLATQYKGVRQRAVCDNTLSIGLRERASEFRVRHVKGNQLLINEAREALQVIFTAQKEFDEEIERMMNQEVTDEQFLPIVEGMFEVPEPVMEDGKVKNQRAINNVKGHRAFVQGLWNEDPKVAPWRLTRWGAAQAFNTWFHWGRGWNTGEAKVQQIKNTVTGDTATWDRKVDQTINRVLVGA